VKQTLDEFLKEAQEKGGWTSTLTAIQKHSLHLAWFIFSLEKKKKWKTKWKSKIGNKFFDRKEPLLVVRKNGNVVFRDRSDLQILAHECFERGIAYFVDECQQAMKAGEIYTGLKEEDHKKVEEFFNNRIEQIENLLHNRPVANLKYETKHFEEVDELVVKGMKQTAAFDEVTKKYDFNRESFEKQYRKRHLDEMKKKKKKEVE
jgi:hypothetical protein